MRKHLLIVFVLVFAASLSAQNMTSSPFSRYGYGLLDANTPNTYRGMGGVGIGMRSNKVICSAQPASYTACDSMTFMFDVAASVGWDNYQDVNGKRNRATGNLEYLTMQFPIWRQHIAFAAGVVPYSVVGYNILVPDKSGNVPSYTPIAAYTGEGGISEVFVGLSFNICDWVALGANMYYMFGETTNARSITFSEAGLTPYTQLAYTTINSFRFRYGLQVFHSFEGHDFSLGAIFENKQRLKSEYYVIESSILDTIGDPITNGFEMPMVYGVGGSYTWQKRLMVSFDYERECMASALYLGQIGTMNDRNRYALGVEYRNNPVSQRYVDRVMWRVGCRLTDNYMKDERMSNVKDITASIGIGLPLRNAGTIFNASVEYTHRGNKSFLEENELKLTINAAICENWFFKRRL